MINKKYLICRNIHPGYTIIYSVIEFIAIWILYVSQYVDGVYVGFEFLFPVMFIVFMYMFVAGICNLKRVNWIQNIIYIIIMLFFFLYNLLFIHSYISNNFRCDLCP